MKKHVSIRLQSCQLDGDGKEERTETLYDGLWYHQDQSDYLVYQDSDVQTTLKWNQDEWRLFRRGPDLEGWQAFRVGESLESDLRLHGSLLPLTTTAHRLQAISTSQGGELQLEYTLHSGPELLGNFTLVLHLTLIDEDLHA